MPHERCVSKNLFVFRSGADRLPKASATREGSAAAAPSSTSRFPATRRARSDDRCSATWQRGDAGVWVRIAWSRKNGVDTYLRSNPYLDRAAPDGVSEEGARSAAIVVGAPQSKDHAPNLLQPYEAALVVAVRAATAARKERAHSPIIGAAVRAAAGFIVAHILLSSVLIYQPNNSDRRKPKSHMYHLSRRRAPPPALECPGECSATAQVVQSCPSHGAWCPPRVWPTAPGDRPP